MPDAICVFEFGCGQISRRVIHRHAGKASGIRATRSVEEQGGRKVGAARRHVYDVQQGGDLEQVPWKLIHSPVGARYWCAARCCGRLSASQSFFRLAARQLLSKIINLSNLLIRNWRLSSLFHNFHIRAPWYSSSLVRADSWADYALRWSAQIAASVARGLKGTRLPSLSPSI